MHTPYEQNLANMLNQNTEHREASAKSKIEVAREDFSVNVYDHAQLILEMYQAGLAYDQEREKMRHGLSLYQHRNDREDRIILGKEIEKMPPNEKCILLFDDLDPEKNKFRVLQGHYQARIDTVTLQHPDLQEPIEVNLLQIPNVAPTKEDITKYGMRSVQEQGWEHLDLQQLDPHQAPALASVARHLDRENVQIKALLGKPLV